MMEHKLIIAEKPSVAKSIAAVVAPGYKQRRGYLEGNGYLISWCFGHLAKLADASYYNSDFAKWNMKDLPILPSTFRFRIQEDKREQFDVLATLIESRADAVIVMNSETSQKPVYPYSGDYAQEHGEVDQYRESNKLNIACKQAIQTAIASHHDGMRLDPEAAHSVVARFGKARTSFILANTIQQKDYDGRFSPGNKAWARPIPILPDENTFGDNCRQRYVLSTHPGLVDTFVNVFRKEYCQEQQQVQKVKPSVRQKLQATQPQKNAPKISAHFKQKER